MTPRTVASWTPLSMGFPREDYLSGLPFPSPGGHSWLRDWTCISHWQADSLPLSTREALNKQLFVFVCVLYIYVCVCVCGDDGGEVIKSCLTLEIPWTVPPVSSVHGIFQALFPSPEDIPNPRVDPALQADSLPTEPPGKSIYIYMYVFIHTHTYIYVHMHTYVCI